MKKLAILILLVLVVSLPLASASSTGIVKIKRIRPIDFVTTANDYLSIKVGVRNEQNVRVNDLKATVMIPELGIRKRVPLEDLSENEQDSADLYISMSDVPAGEYWARIVTSNDNCRRVKHRPIIVVN